MTLSGGKTWYGLPVADKARHLASFASCLIHEPQGRRLLCTDIFDDPQRVINRDDGARYAMPGEPIVTVDDLGEMAIGGMTQAFKDASITMMSQYRRRFRTESRRCGVGPSGTLEGDLLCVLYGVDMPLVIRPQGDGYVLIGECYVYDLMHGEALELVAAGTATETWIKLV